MAERTDRQGGFALQIGSALGIPIRVHFTFLLLVVWYGILANRNGDNLPLAITFLILVFACVVLHELGHAAMARRFGVRTREIVLYPIGGIARLENMPSGRAELAIALAGPAVNLVLAALLLLPVLVAGLPLAGIGSSLAPLASADQLVGRLLVVNVALFVFNLIPAFPMDGGRVLRAALAMRVSQARATEVAAGVGQTVAILFGLAGIVLPNILLMLVALFVFIGASQEALFERQRSLVGGAAARDAMITRFEVLGPQDSLAEAARRLLATHQPDFPVVDAWNRLAGVLPRTTLLQGLASAGAEAAVLDVMERDVPTIAPGDPLERALDLLRQRPGCPVAVLEADRLVGMITLENLTEFIEVARRTAPVSARPS